MKLLFTFARRYPLQGIITVIAILFAGIAEGFGITAMLPLLSIILGENSPFGGGGAMGQTRIGSTLEKLINDVFASLGLTPSIGGLLLMLMGSIILKNLLVLLANRQVGYTVAHVATDLRMDLLRALFRTRWEFFLKQPVGKLTNAIASEASRASSAFGAGTKMASIFIEAMVYAILAILVSWKATVIAACVGVFIFFILRRFIRKARRAGKRQTNLLQSLIAQLTDSLQSIKPLKAMGRETSADTVLKDKTTRLNRTLQKRVMSKAALTAFQDPLIVGFLALTLYVALVHLKMTLTTVIAMIYLIRRILKNAQKIQQEYQNLVVFESAYWSLQQKIHAAEKEEEKSLGSNAPALAHAVRLEKVWFSYDKTWILQDINLEIPVGSFVALVGPSGAGKTTVADLIIGLIRPQRGEIWIDDIPLRDVDIRAWRHLIGYVPQEVVLLHDSVSANVTLGDEQITKDHVEQALRAAGVWDVVSQMPKGMQTVVGERGSKLSGGQRQRIAIARALVNGPRFLIMDEATTALDPETEAEICKTLRKLRRNVAILSISHQSTMLEAADFAYRIEDGAISLVKESEEETSRKKETTTWEAANVQ